MSTKVSINKFDFLNSVPPSSTLVMNEQSRLMEESGQHIYKFGFGQSPFPVPPSMVEALRKNAGKKEYLPVQGLPQLRSAIADYYLNTEGVSCCAESIMIGPGSKELIYDVMMSIQANVILPAPYWVSYAPQAKLANRKVYHPQWIYDGEWRFPLEEVDIWLENNKNLPAILVLNDPLNPTGTGLSTSAQDQLAEIARKHDLIIIADEIYARLKYGDKHRSFASVYPEGTIVTGGISKWAGAGGWRLGVAVFPNELKPLQETIQGIASETFSCVSAPIQYASVVAYQKEEDVERQCLHSRRILQALGEWSAKMLQETGVDVQMPTGGFYLMPIFNKDTMAKKGVKSSEVLTRVLLEETGVALLPGTAFGMEAEYLSARLAFVDFDGKTALEASYNVQSQSTLTSDWIAEYCPKCWAGISRLCTWIKE